MSLFYKEHRTIEVHAYSCSMSEELRGAFEIFYNAYQAAQEKSPATPQGIRMKELRGSLTDNQYRNFAKLQYFGIIELEKKVYWQLTKLGAEFYLGISGVLSPCAWMDGRTLPDDHEAWKTFKGKRRSVFIETPLTAGFKGREQYEKERRGDTLLSDDALKKIEAGKAKALHATEKGIFYRAPEQPDLFNQAVTKQPNLS